MSESEQKFSPVELFFIILALLRVLTSVKQSIRKESIIVIAYSNFVCLNFWQLPKSALKRVCVSAPYFPPNIT